MKLMTKAFTLFELLVVVIIVGVLAAVALPKYADLVEGSRCAEAVTQLGAIRRAMDDCWVTKNRTFVGCDYNSYTATDTLNLALPGPDAHFDYQAFSAWPNAYVVWAGRNGVENTYPGTLIVRMGYGMTMICDSTGGGGNNTVNNDNTVSWCGASQYRGFLKYSPTTTYI